MTEEERQVIAQMRQQGALLKVIAHAVGRHEATVSKACKRMGIAKPYSLNKNSVKARRHYAKVKASKNPGEVSAGAGE